MKNVQDFIKNATLADLKNTEKVAGTKLEQVKIVLSKFDMTRGVTSNDTGSALALLTLLNTEARAEFVAMFTLVMPMEWIERTYATYQLSAVKDLSTSLDTVQAFATLCTAVKMSPVGVGEGNNEVLWLAFTDLCMVNRLEGAADVVIPLVEEMPDELFAKLIVELEDNLQALGQEDD